jgi:hypothetical protein
MYSVFDRVTFAGTPLQADPVEHFDVPTRVPDESRVLQLQSGLSNADSGGRIV